MARDFAKAFYGSKAWKKTRAAYRKAAGGLCERCFSKGIITPGEIVHHKIEITPDNINDPTITLSFNNLELVCRECHTEEHEDIYAIHKKQRYYVDKSGHVRAVIASP